MFKRASFLFIFSITFALSFAQDEEKAAGLLELLEYKLLFELLDVPPAPTYITQVTKYPLAGLGSAGIRTKIEVHKYVLDGEPNYFMQFLQNYDACYISYDGIIKLQDALETLKKELSTIGGIEKDFTNNYVSRGSVFKMGYYFFKGQPKWYIVVGESGYRTSLEGTYWLEESLKEAKEKIESLMNANK